MTNIDFLDELRTISHRVGINPLLVQGAGGNTSLKNDGLCWVKGSGKWLADALDDDMFVPVRIDGARLRLAAREADPIGPELSSLCPPGLRPSIEASLHVLLPHRCVVHVHCLRTLVWAVREDGPERLTERLDGLAWAFVPYARPGLPLTAAVATAIAAAATPPDVLVLGNHGLIVGADSAAAADALLGEVMRRLDAAPRPVPAPALAALAAVGAACGYRLPRHAESHAVALDPVGSAIAEAGSLYPDHVVFLGPGFPLFDAGDGLPAAIGGTGGPPAVGVRGQGVLIRDDATNGAEEMLRCLSLLACRLIPGSPVRYLSADDERALVDWDAEKFRSMLDRKS